jgi:hypothetical protein
VKNNPARKVLKMSLKEIEYRYEKVWDLVSVTTMSATAKDIILNKLQELWKGVTELDECVRCRSATKAKTTAK